MTTNPPLDLISLLCLDPGLSLSPFGGQHRTLLISKDFTNTGDFVFMSLLQHFTRREPKTPILLVTLNHDWTNYSASAAKCGFNLRRTQNMGNIEVLNLMGKVLDSVKEGFDLNLCNCIIDSVEEFIKKHSIDSESNVDGARMIKPIIVMIDDLSILLTTGSKPNEVYRIFSLIDKSMRDRSKELNTGHLSHFIVQTMITSVRTKQQKQFHEHLNDDLNYLVSNMENQCDLSLTLKSLETGYSTRVDGTIKIVDNRLPAVSKASVINVRQQTSALPSLLPSISDGQARDVGIKKAFFFKLGDRRVRLTSSALIF